MLKKLFSFFASPKPAAHPSYPKDEYDAYIEIFAQDDGYWRMTIYSRRDAARLLEEVGRANSREDAVAAAHTIAALEMPKYRKVT